jgi:HAD superfamily hydrolase (TIGR01509 family)
MSDETQRWAVLWDLDGTIVDSAEYHWQSWRDTLALEGFVLSRSEFDGSFGQRNDRVLCQILGDKLSREAIERIGSAKEELYRKLVRTRGLSLLPGVGLTYLRDGAWLQCVASSAPRENIETVLSQVNIIHFFEAIVSAEEIEHGKPDPEVFLLAAERVDVDPQHCIVIEDSPAGIEAASKAAMRSIGVLTTHSQLDADIVVESLEALSSNVFTRD